MLIGVFVYGLLLGAILVLLFVVRSWPAFALCWVLLTVLIVPTTLLLGYDYWFGWGWNGEENPTPTVFAALCVLADLAILGGLPALRLWLRPLEPPQAEG